MRAKTILWGLEAVQWLLVAANLFYVGVGVVMLSTNGYTTHTTSGVFWNLVAAVVCTIGALFSRWVWKREPM